MSPRHVLRFAFAVSATIFACGGPAPVTPVESAAPECGTTGARGCKDATDCGGSNLHCTGGRCFANHAGCPCSETVDCGASAHCTKGTCFANAAGVPCTAPDDCGPRAHCTAGGCYANNTGSPCSSPTDCGPGSSCVSGTCN